MLCTDGNTRHRYTRGNARTQVSLSPQRSGPGVEHRLHIITTLLSTTYDEASCLPTTSRPNDVPTTSASSVCNTFAQPQHANPYLFGVPWYFSHSKQYVGAVRSNETIRHRQMQIISSHAFVSQWLQTLPVHVNSCDHWRTSQTTIAPPIQTPTKRNRGQTKQNITE